MNRCSLHRRCYTATVQLLRWRHVASAPPVPRGATPPVASLRRPAAAHVRRSDYVAANRETGEQSLGRRCVRLNSKYRTVRPVSSRTVSNTVVKGLSFVRLFFLVYK